MINTKKWKLIFETGVWKYFLLLLVVLFVSVYVSAFNNREDKSDLVDWALARGEKVEYIQLPKTFLDVKPFSYSKMARYYRIKTDSDLYTVEYLFMRRKIYSSKNEGIVE